MTVIRFPSTPILGRSGSATASSRPSRFEPGRLTPVRLTLQDINHTFRSGHRFMVQVQSTWFPLMDRNPQTFADIYHAKEVQVDLEHAVGPMAILAHGAHSIATER